MRYGAHRKTISSYLKLHMVKQKEKLSLTTFKSNSMKKEEKKKQKKQKSKKDRKNKKEKKTEKLREQLQDILIWNNGSPIH